MKHKDKKVWLVDHPTSQYEEDVKDMAARAMVRIVDSKYSGSVDPDKLHPSMPELTKKKPRQLKKEQAEAKAGNAGVSIA